MQRRASQPPSPPQPKRAAEDAPEAKDLPPPRRFTRAELEKRRELEAERKAGVGPVVVDDEGRGYSSQIPYFISKTPWYLTHQIDLAKKNYRQQPESDIYVPVKRKIIVTPDGASSNDSSIAFREGACENCGAISHTAKECLERPRKVSAKHAACPAPCDEFLEERQLGFEAKRDRWRDFDAADFGDVIRQWERIEQTKKNTASASETQQDNAKEKEEDADDDKYAESSDMPGQKIDLQASTRMTVRNLRIREDTAKYLRNLDVDSAHYDPKTRSMRENPNKDCAPCDLVYFGDEHAKSSGDAACVKQMSMFAWEAARAANAAATGTDVVHFQAHPTLSERSYTEAKAQKKHAKSALRKSLLEKYGGDVHDTPNPFA